MGAGVAADEFENGMSDWLEERDGEAGRKRDAEGVAVAGCVFGGNEAAFTGDAEFEQAAGADEAGQRFEQESGR